MLRRRPKKTAGRYRLYCNLGYNLSEEVVRRYFQQICTHGQILDVYIPRHNSGRNKGYGFTTFENEADLLTALQTAEHVIGGNVVKINRAGPRPDFEGNEGDQGELDLPIYNLVQQTARLQLMQKEPGQQISAHGKGPRLYVGGIPDGVDANLIKLHFSRWGNVVDIYFPGKSSLKRVNYCFVTFDNWQAAQRSCNQSERCIAGRPIQSISLAEERTVDGRDAGFTDDTSRPTFPGAGMEWLQQIKGLQQNGLQGTGMGDQQNYLRIQGPDGGMGGNHGAANGDEGLREQLMVRSMKAGGIGAPEFANQSQYWPPNYHQPHYHTIQPSASSANMPGVDHDFGLLRNNPTLNGMTYGELEALQQAMTMNQGYSQADRPPEVSMPHPHWRPDVVADPLAGNGHQRMSESYREWQPPVPARPAASSQRPDFSRITPHSTPTSQSMSQSNGISHKLRLTQTYPQMLPRGAIDSHLQHTSSLGNSPAKSDQMTATPDSAASPRGRSADNTSSPSAGLSMPSSIPSNGSNFF